MQSLEKQDEVVHLLKQGNILKREGKLEEAAAVYRRCIEANPTSAWSYNNLGEVLEKLGDLDEAVAAYRKAISISPNSAWFYNNLGEAFFKQGNWDKAIKSYRLAININPDISSFYKNLGNAFYQKGMLEKAGRNYKKVIELNQNTWEISEKIGDLLALKHRWDEAMGYYDMAASLNPEFSLEERFIRLGKIKRKEGNLSQEVRFYRQAIELNKTCREKLPIFIANKEELGKIAFKSNEGIVYSEIHPEITFSLPPPKTIYPTIHPHFSELEKKSGSSSVVVIPGGRAWINDSTAIAIASSEDEILIKDVFRGRDITTLPLKNLPQVLELDEPTAFLSVRWGHNYYHWMLDLVPKIGLLKESGLDLKSIGKFVVSSQSERPFQKETLETLGIPSERIIESTKYHYIKAKSLIVPSLFPKIGTLTTISKWACQYIKKEFLKLTFGQKLDASERIYISREDTKVRRVINESEVVEFLSKFGIRKVTLTSLSVAEQALLLAGAKVVVAPHGAGLTNLLFCNPGTKVIELMSPDAVRPFYHQLSHHCSLEYSYLFGESVDAVTQDLKINIDLLSDLLKMAGIY